MSDVVVDESQPTPGAVERPTFEHRPPKRGLIGPFGGRQIVGGILVVVLTGVLIVVATTPLGQVGGDTRGAPQATAYILDPNAQGLQPGQRAPELTVQHADGSTFQLTDLGGKPVRLADLRGHPVWINFWADWCPPCQAETPILRDTYATYRSQGLVVIGVAVQEPTVADVAQYAQTYGLDYTIASDTSGDIFRLYKVGGLPQQYFIGTDGIIRTAILGPVSRDAATQLVQAILPGDATSTSPSTPPSPTR